MKHESHTIRAAEIRLRERLYRQLDAAAWPYSGLSPLNRIISGMIIAASAIAIIETEAALQERASNLLFAIEAAFAVVFSVEYLARLYAAGEDERYRGFRGRLHYIVTGWAIVDLLAILPFILTFGAYNSVLIRLLKLGRILRLARLGNFTRAWDALSEGIWNRRFEMGITSGGALLMLLASSSFLYLAEGTVQPDDFGSIPRAFWWSIATLTTVGYGDATPLTALGKVFAGITALAGIGLVAMPAGILAAAFSDAFQRQEVTKAE